MQKVEPPPQEAESRPKNKPARNEKLSDEIRLVRSLIRTIDGMASQDDGLEKMLNVLSTVSRACASLASLLRAEKALEENQSGTDYIRAALNNIREDMKRKGIDSILTSGLD
ncbi:MAG TPA: hypothetical protein VN364_10340 [Bellilinea sp.]|nr:hypothetical protein [Bellilinea sp.]